jgi:hypothetical protein
MLKQKLVTRSNEVSKIVIVMATKDIMLMSPNGFQIFINEGSELLLDVREMIANYEDYHFDVSADEISIIN